MLGIDQRAARVTWTVFLVSLLIFLIWHTREAILMFVAALFLAYMIAPMVSFVHARLLPRASRTIVLAVVYVLLLATVGVLLTFMGARAAEEAANLTEQLPALVSKHGTLETLPVPDWLAPYKARMIEMLRTQLQGSAQRILPLLQRAVGGVASLLGSIGFLVLVPILAFLFLKDAEQLRDSLISLMPSRHRRMSQEVLAQVHVSIGNYIRALAILAALTSVVYVIFLQMIGFPYAVLLAVLAAPLELIPFFGPLIGMVLIILVAVFTAFPHIWWIVLFFVAYRGLQDYVLQPYLFSSGVELHPLVVMFGALAGQQIGGLWGMFLSLPVMASLRILHHQVAQRRRDLDVVVVEEGK